MTATLIGKGPLAVEGISCWSRISSRRETAARVSSSRVYSLMGNVVLAAPLRWNEYGLRPFVSGGLGLMHATQTTIPNILPLNENLLGYNVGGGAVGFITRHTGLRFDLRYYRSLSRTENHRLRRCPAPGTGPEPWASVLKY